MTTPQPTGRLFRREDGVYVVFDRIFETQIEDVWASLTQNDRLEKWIGVWKGQPLTRAIKFLMTAETTTKWEDVAILDCQPPYRLELENTSSEQPWKTFAHLTEATARTVLTLGCRLRSPKDEANIGVGWDYYLDRLVASRNNEVLPSWDDYFPALLPYYKTLAEELEQS